MEIVGKLVKKNFTVESGEVKDYYVIEYPLVDGSKLEVPLKGDKAKLLLMSLAIEKNNK